METTEGKLMSINLSLADTSKDIIVVPQTLNVANSSST